ncbi:MAG: threonylcarbamoyl-AMP synthase, partial [Thermoprotei archaeon]
MTLTLDVKGVKGEGLRKALKPALEVLRSGGLAVYPTDTVYGLGCNPLDEAALRRLLEVKGRVGKP